MHHSTDVYSNFHAGRISSTLETLPLNPKKLELGSITLTTNRALCHSHTVQWSSPVVQSAAFRLLLYPIFGFRARDKSGLLMLSTVKNGVAMGFSSVYIE